jgi:hypothetical protein
MHQTTKVDPNHSTKVEMHQTAKVDTNHSTKVDTNQTTKLDLNHSSKLNQNSLIRLDSLHTDQQIPFRIYLCELIQQSCFILKLFILLTQAFGLCCYCPSHSPQISIRGSSSFKAFGWRCRLFGHKTLRISKANPPYYLRLGLYYHVS